MAFLYEWCTLIYLTQSDEEHVHIQAPSKGVSTNPNLQIKSSRTVTLFRLGEDEMRSLARLCMVKMIGHRHRVVGNLVLVILPRLAKNDDEV